MTEGDDMQQAMTMVGSIPIQLALSTREVQGVFDIEQPKERTGFILMANGRTKEVAESENLRSMDSEDDRLKLTFDGVDGEDIIIFVWQDDGGQLQMAKEIANGSSGVTQSAAVSLA